MGLINSLGKMFKLNKRDAPFIIVLLTLLFVGSFYPFSVVGLDYPAKVIKNPFVISGSTSNIPASMGAIHRIIGTPYTQSAFSGPLPYGYYPIRWNTFDSAETLIKGSSVDWRFDGCQLEVGTQWTGGLEYESYGCDGSTLIHCRQRSIANGADFDPMSMIFVMAQETQECSANEVCTVTSAFRGCKALPPPTCVCDADCPMPGDPVPDCIGTWECVSGDCIFTCDEEEPPEPEPKGIIDSIVQSFKAVIDWFTLLFRGVI